MSELPDRRVVQCNHAGDRRAVPGARAYLARPNPGGFHDRIVILLRTRRGRWIETWEDIRRLSDFRAVTLPPGHPRYDDERIYDYEAETMAATLETARAQWSTPVPGERGSE